jgi:transcription antitermination factor NusG
VPTPIQFERGDKVRVADGPYRGVEGVVEAVEAGRMQVILPVYGRAIRMQFEVRQVRPL